MELITVDIPTDNPDSEYILATISDVHVGARDFHREGFKRYVNWIKNEPKAIPIILGDLAEHISSSDKKRWDSRNIDQSYKPSHLANLCHHELNDFFNMIQPIADRIIMVGSGNHELKIGTKGEFDPHFELLRMLKGNINDDGLPQEVKLSKNLTLASSPADGNYQGFIRLRFTNKNRIIDNIKIYYHHGAKGGTAGSITTYLDKLLSEYQADIVLIGHGHRLVAHEKARISPSHKWHTIETKTSIAVMNGAWKVGSGSGYTTYEAKSGYFPSMVGPVLVRVNPHKGLFIAALGDRPWET